MRLCSSFPAVPRLWTLGLVALLLSGTGCGGPDASEGERATASDTQRSSASDTSFQQRFAAPIERAYADSVWKKKKALAGDLTVSFGGRTTLEGRLLMQTNMGRTRLELGGDTVAVYDGEQAWVAPDTAAMPGARFQLLTWPYFASVPHKLRDPGTHLADRDSMPMHGAPMPAARLTFASGTGDTPDDWYVLYRDPKTNRLAAMGYIVTYGPATAEDATPHAIVYGGYEDVDGVPVSTEWTFRHWSKEHGPHGDTIGRVTLRTPHFTQPPDSAFTPPPGAQKSPPPTPAGR